MNANAKLAVVLVSFAGLIWFWLFLLSVWAYKNRQFSDQDRARYLALRSGPPRDEKVDRTSGPQPEPRGEADEAPRIQNGNAHHVST